MATSLNNLAVLYASQSRYVDAELLYRRTLAMLRESPRARASNYGWRLSVDLAVLYAEQSRYAEAEPLYRRALAIDQEALGPVHPGLATRLNNLAALYASDVAYANAAPLYRRALKIYEISPRARASNYGWRPQQPGGPLRRTEQVRGGRAALPASLGIPGRNPRTQSQSFSHGPH